MNLPPKKPFQLPPKIALQARQALPEKPKTSTNQPTITQAVAYEIKGESTNAKLTSEDNSINSNNTTALGTNRSIKPTIINSEKSSAKSSDSPGQFDNMDTKQGNSNLVELPQAVASNFLDLQSKLEANNPDIRMNLIVIHRELAKDPAIVTILTYEQIGVIFAGYSKQTGIEVVKAAGTGRGKKIAAKDMSLSDFD